MQRSLWLHQLLSKRITLFQEAMRYFVGVIPILHQFESGIFIIQFGEFMRLRGPQVVPRLAHMGVVDIVQLDAIIMGCLRSKLVVSTEVLRFFLNIWLVLLLRLLMVIKA